jgi:hypothetical protein
VDPPQRRRPVRRTGPPRPVGRRPRRVADQGEHQRRGGQAATAERGQRDGQAAVRERRQDERGDGHPERLRALPDGHRDTPLAGGEPAQHQPPARGVHGGGRGTGDEQGGAECRHTVQLGTGQQRHRTQAQSEDQYQPLAVPVGGRAPGDEGDQQPGDRTAGEQPRLGQGEPVRAQCRDQERRAVLCRATRRDRDQPGDQHHPALLRHAPDAKSHHPHDETELS